MPRKLDEDSIIIIIPHDGDDYSRSECKCGQRLHYLMFHKVLELICFSYQHKSFDRIHLPKSSPARTRRMFCLAEDRSSTTTRAISSFDPWSIRKSKNLGKRGVNERSGRLRRKSSLRFRVCSHQEDFWCRIVATMSRVPTLQTTAY